MANTLPTPRVRAHVSALLVLYHNLILDFVKSRLRNSCFGNYVLLRAVRSGVNDRYGFSIPYARQTHKFFFGRFVNVKEIVGWILSGYRKFDWTL